MKYAIVMYDDVIDLIINGFNFYHGRFISEFIAILFVKLIPDFFNIHVQNFAVVSECLLKIFLLIIMVIIINKPLNAIFRQNEIKYWGIFYFLTFFTLFAFLCRHDVALLFHTLQFNLGYILPIPFFILFWHKIGNVYTNDIVISKSTLFWLILLSLYIAQSNELFAFSGFFLLASILTEKIIKRENGKYYLVLLCSMFFIFCFVLTHKFFISVFLNYYTGIQKSDISACFLEFVNLYIKSLFADNILLILPIILCFILILCSKTNKKIKLNTIRYFSYTYLGFLLFFFLLFFIGKSCPQYGVGMQSDDNNFWILYKPFLLEWQVLLYASFIYIYKIFNNYTDICNYKKYLIVSIFLISCLFYIKTEFYLFNSTIYDFEMKKNQYLIEKIAKYYTDRNEVIFMPITELSVIQDGNSIVYDENKIYNKNFNSNIYEFLSYIEQIYFGGEERTKGIIFLNKEDAIDRYRTNGGTITESELNELNFNKISKYK